MVVAGPALLGAVPATAAEARSAVSLTVNGTRHTVTVDNRTSLLDLLREHLGLPGTKKGCDAGACGACTGWSTGGGYCTPGQIMSGIGCVREGRTVSPAEIREWMSGNICRCGCYVKIVRAVQQTAKGR